MTLAALRARLTAAPRDIELHVELADALTELVDADEKRTPMAADADESIELLRTAAVLAGAERPDLRAAVLVNLGQKVAWRFTALLEEAAVPEDQLQHEADEAISCLRRAFDSAGEAGINEALIETEPRAAIQLAGLLRLRFHALGELDDLSAAIDYEQRLLGVLAADDEDRIEVLYRLGVDYTDRHDQEADGRRDDLNHAIACLRELRELIGDDHPQRPGVAARLGLALGYRVLRSPEESSGDEFAEAIDELTLARGAFIAGQDTAFSHLIRFRLGMVRAFHSLCQGGDAQEHDLVITELSELTDDPETTSAQADSTHLILAFFEFIRNSPVGLPGILGLADTDWSARFREIMKSPVDLGGDDTAGAIARHLDAISESAVTDPQFATMMSSLRTSATMLQRPDTMSAADLDEILAWVDDMTPELGRLGVLSELAAVRAGINAGSAHKKGDRAGVASATDQIIDAATALDEGHPLRALTRDLLGALTGTLSLTPRSAAESSLAIARIERILAELPDDHPDRARALTKAAVFLFNGMVMDRSLVSFDRVREMLTQTVEREAADQENASVNHFLLGILNGFQGASEHDFELVESGIDLLKRAIELAPEAHPLRSMIGPGLGGILYTRALLGGDLENLDAAEFFSKCAELAPSEESIERAERRATMSALGDYLAAAAKLARNRHNLDTVLLDEVTEEMATAAAQFADDDPVRQVLSSTVNAMQVVLNALSLADGDLAAADVQGLRTKVDALVDASSHIPEGRLDQVMDTAFAAMAQVMQGFIARDQRALNRGISTLGRICAIPDLVPHERLSALGCLSMGLRMRYQLFHRHQDLSNAINRLEQAQALIAQSPPDGTDAAPLLHLLGDCYHARADPNLRDRQRALEVGMRALRERANDVLLQSTSERALNTAIATSGEAADVAYWCLADRKGAAAVEALELGRAIVLHFVTFDASIPKLLSEGGHLELAAEWATESDRMHSRPQLPWNFGDDTDHQDRRAGSVAEMMANLGGAAIPSNLRRRVLRAVEGTDVHARLLSPPPIADIAGALRATGSSALVYLLPGEEARPGIAVIVYPDGAVVHRELPGLRCERGTVFDAFVQAQRDLHAALATWQTTDVSLQQQLDRWQSRLNDVCDRAWTVAMDEVLSAIDRPSRGRVTRLVLVPVGELGMVPWHAARRTVPGGELRYSCQDAVISYASSARQLIDTSRRLKLPWHSTPAVVCVGSDLSGASKETEEINRRFYPHGTYLRPGGSENMWATKEQVLALLPSKHSAGASLLHLGCHAVHEDPPLSSHLVLADERLYVRDLLEQARGRSLDAQGGLVVLAACASDLTGSAHDEALTLATAFIASGSIGVVGTRWAVEDAPTALFMVMFHHYLNRGYDDPATALRAAQRWMLDKRRKLPEGISHLFADELSLLDLSETGNWAAFTYQGQ